MCISRHITQAAKVPSNPSWLLLGILIYFTISEVLMKQFGLGVGWGWGLCSKGHLRPSFHRKLEWNTSEVLLQSELCPRLY